MIRNLRLLFDRIKAEEIAVEFLTCVYGTWTAGYISLATIQLVYRLLRVTSFRIFPLEVVTSIYSGAFSWIKANDGSPSPSRATGPRGLPA